MSWKLFKSTHNRLGKTLSKASKEKMSQSLKKRHKPVAIIKLYNTRFEVESDLDESLVFFKLSSLLFKKK